MLPTRSFLFVPALNARAVEKSKGLTCDGVILDLEDSISPERKPEARQVVADVLHAGGFDALHQLVRINDARTSYFSDDVSVLAKSGVPAILVPKVEHASEVETAAAILDGEEAAGDTDIWIMIESALGVMHLSEICAASPRLKGIIIGPNDLLKDLRAKDTPGQEALLTSYGLCLLAARAHGLICIDGIYKQFNDMVGYGKNCEMGRAFGFDGKSLIHPAQIDPANAAFGPSVDEIDKAKRQIKAFEAADAAGLGVMAHEGELLEALHVDQAQKLLDMAAMIAKRESK
jgi:citrate lyase beta subunit